MSTPTPEMVEIFLQEASEHLQFLREYAGILQDPYPAQEDVQRLYISAHGLRGTSATYGYAQFSEISSKLAHIFQYASNASISPETAAPLVEFLYEAIEVLESDLLMISSTGGESDEEIQSFKQRFPFAFQGAAESQRAEASCAASATENKTEFVPSYAAEFGVGEEGKSAAVSVEAVPGAEIPAAAAPVVEANLPAAAEAPAAIVSPTTGSLSAEELLATADQTMPVEIPAPNELPIAEETAPAVPAVAETSVPAMPQRPSTQGTAAAAAAEMPDLAPDEELPAEVMEFFVPEVEEHLQTVTECLLNLEANPSAEEINRLFRAMHTIKGSAAQVGLHRISTVAHRAEDLVGRLRDGELQPSARIVDLCLSAADVLRRSLYRQWTSDEEFQKTAKLLIAEISLLAPEEEEETVALPVASGAEAAAEPAGTPVAAEATPSAEVSLPLAEPETEATEQRDREEVEPIIGAMRREAGTSSVPQSKSVRIALDRLDRMMNAVGELVINRTRMVGRLTELGHLTEVLNFSKARMIEKISEFQEKYEFSRIHAGGRGVPGHSSPRFSPIHEDFGFGTDAGNFAHAPLPSGFGLGHSEFSELEMDRYDDFGILSRTLTEISADITEVLTQLDGFVRHVDGDIDEFTKLAHRLQDEITQARMVPIGNLYTRITRTVRDAAKAAGKQVELTLAGADTELDNNIIQQIADPLLHLVRNAVAHGIERSENRYAAGKADSGSLAVRAYHRGNHIYVEVEDDGRGIDYEKIRQTAIETGFAGAEEAERMTQRDLATLLFRPGFSTAPRKTELAGRGVGLDVVQANIHALNGEVEVETQLGIGTRFTLKVPLTLIISQALFVRLGAATFALPLGFVEEIRRIRDTEIEEVGGKLLTRVREVVTEVVRLDAQLGMTPVEAVNGWYRLVLVNVAGRQVGIVVEEVLRKDEIVIKNLGEFLHNVKLFPGATIAPDGSLILLIDVNRLIMGDAIERRPLMTSANAARIFSPGGMAVAAGDIPAAAIDVVEREKVVILADDSISVRKFVGRMLEKAGYRVRLASDGLEALEIAQQAPSDLIITDLEMPRTNGYELMMHLRQDEATRRVPVMVVTSRAGAKHRDRAMKEGASAFMVKPVQEDQLIAQVRELIGSSGQSAAAAVLGH
jgi:chemosensory pili system protein ChpA (sensor histidine kinase/response regulator)